MHTYQYHKFEFCKRNEYTHRHREKRCTEDRSARTGLSRLLVVFRSTRRDDRRTKQLLRFDRVLTDDKTINLENLSPVFFHPFFSIRDESEARALNLEEFSWRDAHFCGSEAKLERRLPFHPSSTIDARKHPRFSSLESRLVAYAARYIRVNCAYVLASRDE